MMDKPANDGKRFQPIPGYEILSRIGSGGMGTIFKARQISMNRIVALKILKKKDLSDPLPLDRMRREALLIARMDHTHIVKGIDMGETNRYYFFAMEFVEGRSVKAMLDLFGPVDEARAASIILDVARALQYAYEQKLTHRDVKPGNILISESGHTKLTDLGLAKAESDLTLTREGTTLGTPQYISPEQARTPKAVDIRSDIYSLGATFYHMVTGAMPFTGDTMAQVLTRVLFEKPALPETLKPSLHRGTSRVISRMMAKKPAQRYQTPSDLIKDLNVLLKILEGSADETATPLGMAWRKSQRRSWVHPGLFIAAAAMVVVISIFFWLKPWGNDSSRTGYRVQDDRLASLQRDYESGRIPLAHLFGKLTELPLVSERDKEIKDAFRDRVLADGRNMIEDLLDPSSTRYDRALVEGGIKGAGIRLERNASKDLQKAMGDEPRLLPPTLALFWDEKLGEAEALMASRVQDCTHDILERADVFIKERRTRIDALKEQGRFDEAWSLMESLKSDDRKILQDAARDYLETLGAFLPEKSPDPDRFSNDDMAGQVSASIAAATENLAPTLKTAAGEAQAAYLKAVGAAAADRVRAADLSELESGVNILISKAATELEMTPPSLPQGIGMSWPGLEILEPELAPKVAEARKQLHDERGRAGSLALFKEIDEALGRWDFAHALDRLDNAGAHATAFEDFGKSWRKRITTLQSIESGALESLKKYVGQDCRLKTRKGVIYEGEIQDVNLSGRTVSTRLESGQRITLQLENLSMADVLLWSAKEKEIKSDCRGLYYYYKGEFDNAAAQLKEAREFTEATHYLERIEKRNDYEQRAREKEANAINVMLSEAEQALEEKNWKEGLELLDTCRSLYRSTRGWTETRRRRNRLRAELEALEEQGRRTAQLAGLFSVPISMVEDRRVRAHYDFTSKVQLKDFGAYGQDWEIRNRTLVCGTTPSAADPDYFHNRVGVRVEKPFDLGEPLVMHFAYQAPVEGSGPEFMGIAFYGSCFGIRSFPDSAHSGQVNFWNGDLEEYGDFFYIPDFGELRAKKGRVLDFGFERGEKYDISVQWTSARELLFSVDDKEVYRTRSFKPVKGTGIEIRTFREAIIESLTLEGKIKD